VPGASSTVSVVNGVPFASATFTATTPGSYYWEANYSGDGNDGDSSSGCTEVETVLPYPTATTTALTGGGHSGTAISVTEPAGVTDQATLSGPGVPTAGGTVTYSVYSNPACTNLVPGSESTENVVDGVAGASASVSLTVGGNYYWQAVYSGDTDNAGSASTCGPTGEVETVYVPTQLVATPAVASVVEVGTPGVITAYLFNLTATLTAEGHGVAGQTIVFKSGTTALCSAVTNGSGVAACTGSILPTALLTVLGLGYQAHFAANDFYLASSASAGLLQVGGAT
jgi:hypothetical protein